MIFSARRVTDDDIRAIIDDPGAAATLMHGEPPELDIDKAWHAIHYLLTGTEWEAGAGSGAAILGGEPIGVDLGYGPARLLLAEEVKAVVAGLDTVDSGALRRRFNAAELQAADIYPQIWDDTDFDGYVGPNYLELRDFYRRAAAADQAVLLVIS